MVKRLVAGIIKGLIVGAALAALLLKGLDATLIPGFIGYLMAAVTGVVVGLVAGKPIWARNAKLEAGLKAAVGAALAAVGLFVLRRWLNFDVDLAAFGAGQGTAGELSAVSLPLLATVLAVLFELDNTPSSTNESGTAKTQTKQRVEASLKGGFAEPEELEESIDPSSARRSHRR